MPRECYFLRGADRILASSAHWQFVDLILEERFGDRTSTRGRRPSFSAAWLYTYLAIRLVESGWELPVEPMLRGIYPEGVAWPYLRWSWTVLVVSELNSLHALAAMARLRMMENVLEAEPGAEAKDAILVLADGRGMTEDDEVVRFRSTSAGEGLLHRAFREVSNLPLMVVRVSPNEAKRVARRSQARETTRLERR